MASKIDYAVNGGSTAVAHAKLQDDAHRGEPRALTDQNRPSITIRLATATDGQALVRHSIALAKETEKKELDPQQVELGIRFALTHRPGKILVACNGEGEVIGGLLLCGVEWSDWRAGWFWWATSAYVHPDFRRLGVYKALWNEAIRLASEAGALGIRTYVHLDNAISLAAHERLGFERTQYVLIERTEPLFAIGTLPPTEKPE